MYSSQTDLSEDEVQQLVARELVVDPDSYVADPMRWSDELGRAKAEGRLVLCGCRRPHPRLSPHRGRSDQGDKPIYRAALWPFTRDQHAQGCRLGQKSRAEQSWYRPGIVKVAHGAEIYPAFPLDLRGRKETKGHSKNGARGGSSQGRAKLLSVLKHLLEASGVFVHVPHTVTTWTCVVHALKAAIASCTISKRPLAEVLYVHERYVPGNRKQHNARFDTFVDDYAAAQPGPQRLFLLLGELSKRKRLPQVGADREMLHFISNQAAPLRVSKALDAKLRKRFRSARKTLAAGPALNGRVWALYLLRTSGRGGHFEVKDAAFLPATRDYVPCDSVPEIQFANTLIPTRPFIKPMRAWPGTSLHPDFLLPDTEEEGRMVAVEVWGMKSAKYMHARELKEVEYEKSPVFRLLEWDVAHEAPIPDIPAPAKCYSTCLYRSTCPLGHWI